jgi:uncharacterized repeat protein (TIGR03847 family)
MLVTAARRERKRRVESVVFEQHEYERLEVLSAEAIGEPGQRRFRLIVGVSGDLISLWMEKEQLQALGLAIEQLLEQLSTTGLTDAAVEAEPLPASAMVPPNAPDYQVGKMAIGYDEEARLVAYFAHDIEQESDADPIFTGRASLGASKALAEEIAEVVAAGRPRCPRCGELIGPEGHVCPHNNGHLPWDPSSDSDPV